MITDAEERAGAASGGMGSEEGKRLWAAFRDDKSAVGATQGEHDNGPRFKGTQTEDRQGGDAMTNARPKQFCHHGFDRATRTEPNSPSSPLFLCGPGSSAPSLLFRLGPPTPTTPIKYLSADNEAGRNVGRGKRTAPSDCADEAETASWDGGDAFSGAGGLQPNSSIGFNDNWTTQGAQGGAIAPRFGEAREMRDKFRKAPNGSKIWVGANDHQGQGQGYEHVQGGGGRRVASAPGPSRGSMGPPLSIPPHSTPPNMQHHPNKEHPRTFDNRIATPLTAPTGKSGSTSFPPLPDVNQQSNQPPLRQRASVASFNPRSARMSGVDMRGGQSPSQMPKWTSGQVADTASARPARAARPMQATPFDTNQQHPEMAGIMRSVAQMGIGPSSTRTVPSTEVEPPPKGQGPGQGEGNATSSMGSGPRRPLVPSYEFDFASKRRSDAGYGQPLGGGSGSICHGSHPRSGSSAAVKAGTLRHGARQPTVAGPARSLPEMLSGMELNESARGPPAHSVAHNGSIAPVAGYPTSDTRILGSSATPSTSDAHFQDQDRETQLHHEQYRADRQRLYNTHTTTDSPVDTSIVATLKELAKGVEQTLRRTAADLQYARERVVLADRRTADAIARAVELQALEKRLRKELGDAKKHLTEMQKRVSDGDKMSRVSRLRITELERDKNESDYKMAEMCRELEKLKEADANRRAKEAQRAKQGHARPLGSNRTGAGDQGGGVNLGPPLAPISQAAIKQEPTSPRLSYSAPSTSSSDPTTDGSATELTAELKAARRSLILAKTSLLSEQRRAADLQAQSDERARHISHLQAELALVQTKLDECKRQAVADKKQYADKITLLNEGAEQRMKDIEEQHEKIEELVADLNAIQSAEQVDDGAVWWRSARDAET